MWFVVLIVLGLVLLLIIPRECEQARRAKEYSRGIVNYNAGMKEFLYKVNKSPDEIRQALSRRNLLLPMDYQFDITGDIVTFSCHQPVPSLPISYQLSFRKSKGVTFLTVTQADHLREKNLFAIHQNEFWYKLVGAMPVPYV